MVRNLLYREYFVYEIVKTLTGGDGSVLESMLLKLDTDADFELHKIVYYYGDSRVRIRFKDDTLSQYFEKGSVDMRSIIGSSGGAALGGITNNAFLPWVLQKPYRILAGSNFLIDVADLSGNSNTLRIALHGAKLRRGIAPWYEKKWSGKTGFFISGRTNDIADGSKGYIRLEMDMDSHFLVQKITGILTVPAQGSLLLNFQEGQTDKHWTNIPIMERNIIGDGQFPNTLSANRFLRKGSTLLIEVDNVSGQTESLDLTLSGMKLYD